MPIVERSPGLNDPISSSGVRISENVTGKSGYCRIVHSDGDRCQDLIELLLCSKVMM